jgi:hypothetical protein
LIVRHKDFPDLAVPSSRDNIPEAGLTAPSWRARASGAKLRDLMARKDHDSERAALIYQHESRGADQVIAYAIDRQPQSEHSTDEDDDDGSNRMG